MSKTDENSSSNIEVLHNNYKQNFQNYKKFIDFAEKLKKVYSNFAENLDLIFSKNFSFADNQQTSLSPVLCNLEFHIKYQKSEINKFAKYLSKEIIDTFKLLKESNDKVEEKIYKEIFDLNKALKKGKIKLEESRNLYYTKMKNLEKLIFEEESIKINMISQNQEIKDKKKLINDSITECKNDEIKYEKMIDEVNSIIEKEQDKENMIIGFYKSSEQKRINKMNENIQLLLSALKETNVKINNDIDALFKKTINVQIEKDIMAFEKLVEKNYKIEKKIQFIPYEPNANLNDSLKICDKKTEEELLINYEIITLFQKNFKNIYSTQDMSEEKRHNDLRKLCLRLFDEEQNKNFLQEDLDNLLNFMKNSDYRSFFLKYLTNERTNGKCKRPEKLLNELIQIIKTILEIAEKEKNYDNAKNCIILSQTFFKEEINKDNKEEKIYLMEYLKDNEWIHSIKFWQEMIEIDIINNKFKLTEENPGMTKTKIQDALKNVYFSSFLTYSHNMHIFNIDKKDNIDLCLSLIERYQIGEDMKLMLLSSIEDVYKNKNNIKEIPQKKEQNIEIKKKEKIKDKNKKKSENKKIEDDWVICNEDKYNDNINLTENSNINHKNKINNKENEKFIDDFVIQYKNEYNDDFVPNKETNESNININKNINNNIDNEIKEDNINNINIKDDDNNNIIIDDNNLNINEIREINNKKQNYN